MPTSHYLLWCILFIWIKNSEVIVKNITMKYSLRKHLNFDDVRVIWACHFKYFSRLTTLCTHLVWMRIASVATLYRTSGYVKCIVQNFVHAPEAFTVGYKILTFFQVFKFEVKIPSKKTNLSLTGVHKALSAWKIDLLVCHVVSRSVQDSYCTLSGKRHMTDQQVDNLKMVVFNDLLSLLLKHLNCCPY